MLKPHLSSDCNPSIPTLSQSSAEPTGGTAQSPSTSQLFAQLEGWVCGQHAPWRAGKAHLQQITRQVRELYLRTVQFKQPENTSMEHDKKLRCCFTEVSEHLAYFVPLPSSSSPQGSRRFAESFSHSLSMTDRRPALEKDQRNSCKYIENEAKTFQGRRTTHKETGGWLTHSYHHCWILRFYQNATKREVLEHHSSHQNSMCEDLHCPLSCWIRVTG